MRTGDLSLPHTLSADSRRELLDGAERRRLAEGEILFRAGDRATNLYLLDHGELLIEMDIPGDRPHALMNVAPGDLFGWSAVLEPHVETASVRATKASEVVVIPARPLLESIQSNQRLGMDLYRTLACLIASRLAATRTQLAELLTPVQAGRNRLDRGQ
ncbi:MAG TPA: cyclic nucleotide-binding domain-containing protein [Thermoanaerobaculia bacterium]